MPEENKKFRFLEIIVVALLLIALAYMYVTNNKLKLEVASIMGNPIATSEQLRALNFMSDFVDLVLGSEEEIGFDDRLKLENEVRTLQDETILQTWKDFTASKDSMV